MHRTSKHPADSFAYPKFLSIPAGAFWMGSDNDDISDPEDHPLSKVVLPTFEIMQHPVTVAMWLHYLSENRIDWPFLDQLEVVCPSPQCPAVFVSWFEAVAFADWFSAISGENCSLPTENQWEKACRGTDGRNYPWGDDWVNTMPVIWDFFAPFWHTRAEVLSLDLLTGPSGMGDCGGNVWEWCSDNYYSEQTQIVSPLSPLEILEIMSEKNLRGGNANCRAFPFCFSRYHSRPGDHSPFIGFRLVRNISP